MTLPISTALLLMAACAGRAPQEDDGFRRIQQHEATISRAQAERATQPACAAEANAEQRICAASRELCEESLGLHDRDASLRCVRASDVCTAARERGHERCARQAP